LLLFMDNGAWPASILPSKPRLQSRRLSFKLFGVGQDNLPIARVDGAPPSVGRTLPWLEAPRPI
jgi:hypothetical protein